MYIAQRRLLVGGKTEPSPVLDGLIAWIDGRDTITNQGVPDRASDDFCAVSSDGVSLANAIGAYYIIQSGIQYKRSVTVGSPSGTALTGVKTVEVSLKLLSTLNMTQGETVFASFFTSRWDGWRSTEFGWIDGIRAEAIHMLSTTDGTTCKTYYNGVLKRTDTLAQLPNVSSMMAYTKPQGPVGQLAYLGTIRVYNKTLSAEEIYNNYYYEIGLERY
ncbi:MAG: hypothetical protein K6F09_05150 [Clostridiales bacterium]|nr:hypothetical protein [Clostridiales bacterium]